MFGLFKKEEFVCLGVNLEANWTNMESMFTAFELYEKLKDLAFLKEEILDLQKQLDINELGLFDVFNEFNWSSVKKDSVEQLNSTKFIMMISGVRQEFAESKPHIELFKNHIEPSYLKSLASSPKKLDYNIEDVRMDYLKMIATSIIKSKKSKKEITRLLLLSLLLLQKLLEWMVIVL
jgi:hypothetical protein